MEITNQQVLDQANTTFSAMWEKFGQAESGLWELFTEVIPTDSEVNTFDFVTAFPQVQEWVGEKVFEVMRAYAWTINLKTYAKNFAQNYRKVRYDRNGMLGRAIKRFLQTTSIYDKVVTDVLLANPTGYDSVALFSASHPHGPGGTTQSNLASSTTWGPVSHKAAVVAGASLRDEVGEPLNVAYDTIMVGPSNIHLAMEITKSATRVVPVDNTGAEAAASVVATGQVDNFRGMTLFRGGEMQVALNPRLVGSHAGKVFYFDTSKGASPVLLLEGRKPEKQEQTRMDDEGRFMKNELRWSVEADIAAGAGLWQTAYMVAP